MIKKICSLFIFIACLAAFLWPQTIRKPNVAGAFYEADAGQLRAQVDGYLANVKISAPPTSKIQAIIVPHAGHVYSGQVAAQAYKLAAEQDYETVIIIGPSHQYGFEGCSIDQADGYETPLGVAQIDKPLVAALSQASGFKYVPQAHENEHSLEVQIPFIQRALPNAKIVPIIMGLQTRPTVMALADALASTLSQRNALVVASSDMSHFLSKEKANSTDAATISLVQSFQTGQLLRKAEAGENVFCGGGPIVAAMLYVEKRGTPKVHLLKYADSSDAGAPDSQVVGYFSAYLVAGAPPAEFTLTSEEKKELLELAREVIRHFVEEQKVKEYSPKNESLRKEKGAFVTLKKRGALRGCIGYVEGVYPLYETVMQAAVLAATEDPRFPPVTKEELKDLEIEISVLSPLQQIKDPSLVQVGKHGLVISQAEYRGLLLPQVATENRWSRETFLDEACLKAGLPADAWKKGAKIQIFEAIVFR